MWWLATSDGLALWCAGYVDHKLLLMVWLCGSQGMQASFRKCWSWCFYSFRNLPRVNNLHNLKPFLMQQWKATLSSQFDLSLKSKEHIREEKRYQKQIWIHLIVIGIILNHMISTRKREEYCSMEHILPDSFLIAVILHSVCLCWAMYHIPLLICWLAQFPKNVLDVISRGVLLRQRRKSGFWAFLLLEQGVVNRRTSQGLFCVMAFWHGFEMLSSKCASETEHEALSQKYSG